MWIELKALVTIYTANRLSRLININYVISRLALVTVSLDRDRYSSRFLPFGPLRLIFLCDYESSVVNINARDGISWSRDGHYRSLMASSQPWSWEKSQGNKWCKWISDSACAVTNQNHDYESKLVQHGIVVVATHCVPLQRNVHYC